MSIWLNYGGKGLKFGSGIRVAVEETSPVGNMTLRLRFTTGVTPVFSKGTAVRVSADPNIWELTYNDTSWENLLDGQGELIEVLAVGATTGLTNTRQMFRDCSKLVSVATFDTSSVTTMAAMFRGCSSLVSAPMLNTSSATTVSSMFNGCYALTNVPLYDTSLVTNMNLMFYECTDVQSGALALYTQSSTQINPPSSHTETFTLCGSATTTGAAELAQIPSDWGGTGA